MTSTLFHATTIGRQGTLLRTPSALGTSGQALVLSGNELTWGNVSPLGHTHDEYAQLSGRVGGQTLNFGTAAGENGVLSSTAHATKGKIYLGANSAYDEVNDWLGIGTTSPGAKLDVLGEIRFGIDGTNGPELYGDTSNSFARCITRPRAGNTKLSAFYSPSGTESTAMIQVNNSSNLNARGRLIAVLNGSEAAIVTDMSGAGTAPANLYIGEHAISGVTATFGNLSTVQFKFNNVSRVTIDSNGLVGINKTSSIGAQLHVVSGAAARVGAIVQAAAAQSANLFQTLLSDGTSVRARITASGNFSNDQGVTRGEAFGASAVVSAIDGLAVGNGATATSESVAVGRAAIVSSGTRIVLIGCTATTNTSDTTAIGHGVSATGGGSTVVGRGAAAVGLGATAIGMGAVGGTSAAHTGAVAIGRTAQATATNQMMIGGGSYYISDVYIGRGVTDPTPVAVTINAGGGSGTDIAGGNLILAGGKPTGAGAGGSVKIQTAAAGASGTTLRSLVDRVTVTEAGRVGVGTGSPQCLLHALEAGTAGTPALSGSTRMCVQYSFAAASSAYLSVVSGNAGSAGIFLGDTDSESVGRIVYNHTNNDLAVTVGGTARILVNSTGTAFGNNLTSIGAQLHVVSGAAARVGAIVQAAALPSAALQQWQDSSGNAYAEMTSSFGLNLYNVVGTDYERGFMRWSSNTLLIGTEKGGSGTARTLMLRTDGTNRFSINSTGTAQLFGNLQVQSSLPQILLMDAAGSTTYLSFLSSGAVSRIRTVAQDLLIYSDTVAEGLRFNYSNGRIGINEASPDYKLDINGTLGFTPGSSVTPVDNGDVVFEFTDNTTITIRAKGSDGTVRSGTVTLS